jgi:hypothetical protein
MYLDSPGMRGMMGMGAVLAMLIYGVLAYSHDGGTGVLRGPGPLKPKLRN